MPVQAATRVNRSTGNGVTTVFPYTFKLISQSHIRVTVNGVVKTITTDYTVSGVGDAGGGNVTFTSAPANLAAVVLSGSAPYSRSTDYVRNGAFQEETVDNDFDLAVILIQQLDERQGRAIAIPIDDATGTDVELPAAADRASKYLAFDADGNPVVTSGTSSVIVVSAFAETLLDDASAAAARTTLGLAIGTDVQAYDEQLAEIAAISPVQGDIIYHNGTDWAKLAAGTSGHFLKTLGAGANPAWASSPGTVVQYAEGSIATVVTVTGAIPVDDTIPQNTEGTEVLTLAFTPTNASNRLVIEFFAPVVSLSVSGHGAGVALFQDSTADAIGVTAPLTYNAVGSAWLRHEMAAGTTSATTFKVRMSNQQGGTTYVNSAQSTSSRSYGGIAKAMLRVTEYKV